MAQLVRLLLALTTLLVLTQGISTTQVHSVLTQHFNDGSEMATRIINEYLESVSYAQLAPPRHEAVVRSDFARFRDQWVDKMISFVLEELQVDEESARMIRKNPSGFMINYETFKLLEFQ